MSLASTSNGTVESNRLAWKWKAKIPSPKLTMSGSKLELSRAPRTRSKDCGEDPEVPKRRPLMDQRSLGGGLWQGVAEARV